MSINLPKVSIVTITYGHEKYITETLDGVLMQQYDGPVEFIIANDNSPDATDDVVKKYFSENPAPGNFEIKYTKHETNKGMMPNSIWALEQATGKYIALCEGDDYWTDPLKLQKQVDFLEENQNIVMCFHGAEILENSGKLRTYYKNRNFKHRAIVPKDDFLFAGGGSYATCSAFFKKTIIEMLLKEKPEYFISANVGDFPLGLFMITKGEIGYLSDIMAVYRYMHENSWSSINDLNTKVMLHENILAMLVLFNIDTKGAFAKITEVAMKSSYRHLADAYTLNVSSCQAFQKHIALYPKMGLRNTFYTIKTLIFHMTQK